MLKGGKERNAFLQEKVRGSFNRIFAYRTGQWEKNFRDFGDNLLRVLQGKSYFGIKTQISEDIAKRNRKRRKFCAAGVLQKRWSRWGQSYMLTIREGFLEK